MLYPRQDGSCIGVRQEKKYQLEALLYPEQYASPDQIAASVSVMKFTWTASGTCMSTQGERI